MEEKCKWYFKHEGGRDVGPNDPVDEKFKGQPYYSIVREAIQNSLDAVDDENQAVKVDFSFYDLNRNDYPNLFEIETHIKQCQEYYHDNDNSERLFKNMLYYLNGDVEGKKRLQLSCLKISDYNTVGMSYDQNNTKSPFYAFLRAGGVSSKSQGSGGSFGFGKGAYYTLSPIKTVIVSTRTNSDKVIFEGSTILTTHINNNNEKLTAYGYYDNQDGEPTQIENNIPEIFKRTEPGTDVNIIGLWDEPKRKRLMIKSVLNNFWLAIHDEKLIVQVDNVTIDKNSLEQIIDDYFSTDGFESGKADEIEFWNPKSYLKAVKYVKTSDQFQYFEDTLKTVGNVRLYVYLEKGLPNRTSYFRKPKMVVYKQTRNKLSGYSAVLICDNEKGNEIFRQMENPAHNQWDENNYPKEEGRTNKIAKKAKKEINDFVINCLDSLAKIKTGKKIAFLGLEEYLSIPEDLLEKDEEFDYIGNTTNNVSGSLSEEVTDDETGIQTTDKLNGVKIKATYTPKPRTIEDDNVIPDVDGELDITKGRGVRGEGDGPTPLIPPGDSDEIEKGSKFDESTESKVLIKVGLKVAAQNENGNIIHNLIINSEKDILDAQIELLIGADNDRDDSLEILSTSNGNILKNTLKKVDLLSGKNSIKVRFADNLKHSIKIKAYEVL